MFVHSAYRFHTPSGVKTIVKQINKSYRMQNYIQSTNRQTYFKKTMLDIFWTMKNVIESTFLPTINIV